MYEKPIYVTRPYLPPLEEFIPYLEKIWDSKILTNNGPYHRELEEKLCEYLGIDYISLFANGTIALVTALQVLKITGEVITTPYSFVATSHSLLWNGLNPVFVDIDPKTCNIDPSKIEDAITAKTSAILPVHCYGHPCDVDKIQNIADIYGLKVIYDAAHAFGVKMNGESILNFGDLSVLSFHATKVFHTFEGGAIVCRDKKIKQRIDYLKNFGFADEVTVTAPGINGKMSEINSAIGILELRYIDDVLEKRRAIEKIYRDKLKNVPGVELVDHGKNVEGNASYFPILITEEYPMSRDELYFKLKMNGVYGRRYFYPLISDLPMYRSLPCTKGVEFDNAKYISERVICLPIYDSLREEELEKIVKMIEW